ncbi:MAG: glycoside hydrolase family 9 protein [Chitinophagaceae bacterium]
MIKQIACLLFAFFLNSSLVEAQQYIRINQLGYLPNGIKVAVWCSKQAETVKSWQLIDAKTKKIASSGKAGPAFGTYGPFVQTYRIDFSRFQKPGSYYLQAGDAKSPVFEIGDQVYQSAADFCLRYMRQQRTGFNPFLNDSCHTHDGYVLYGQAAGIADSSYVDVVGGWHDASDYLQYSTTSANATYHLLAAYRDFPAVFGDQHQANGLPGSNGQPDILDEARWGLDWLQKMHPRPDWMFNQISDDRDHINMRIPAQDSQYGRGYQRPVYFISGDVQQRGKFLNQTTGTSSTAAKFVSAFSLGADLFAAEKDYSQQLASRAKTALAFAQRKHGVTQTASVKSPYIYAEENWTDDMELAFAAIARRSEKPNGMLDSAMKYARAETITPWLGTDTAKHYQWYPFINLGHFELAKQLKGQEQKELINYYRQGIDSVWKKASKNAFYRGVPFIWCSNNLTVSFAIQCKWYRQLSSDQSYQQLEQANFDWLFGCNPWGTSMVYGLPASGDTPVDPHSAFTHLKNYPIDGGLVDGPVYTSIYKNLIGITLNNPDEYAELQSDLAVYHDDYGDYSSNEPTMDGTASLIYLLAAMEAEAANDGSQQQQEHGAVIRANRSQKKLAMVFTGDEFADGAAFIAETLRKNDTKASFFFTGNFYRQPAFRKSIAALKKDGHYLGAHSDQHLLYCDWKERSRLLITRKEFDADLQANYAAMARFGIKKDDAKLFLPPYEWYNDSIASWTAQNGFQLINYTPGTLSHADYTVPEEKAYRSSAQIWQSILDQLEKPAGLNGYILLMHVGTDPRRTDKFYHLLPDLIGFLKKSGYQLVRVNELLARPTSK